MGRIAAIYDIHGNLPALEAVLKEVEAIRVDRIVVGGDVLPGPMPLETLSRLSHLPIPVDFIHGNGEIAVLQKMNGEQPAAVPEPFRPIIEWTASQLNPEQEKRLRTWPKTLKLETEPLGRLLFCHASPRNENEIFTQLTAESRLRQIFAGVDVDLIVCGHTHMQFDRMIGSVRIVNAGSVGMPFGSPGAYWLLVGQQVEFRCTNYDLEEAASRIRATNYPQAEQFAANNILNPPSQKQMLEIFSKAEQAVR